jgi:hypothetical protein
MRREHHLDRLFLTVWEREETTTNRDDAAHQLFVDAVTDQIEESNLPRRVAQRSQKCGTLGQKCWR